MKWKEGTTKTMNAKERMRGDAGGYEKVKEKRMIKNKEERLGKEDLVFSCSLYVVGLAPPLYLTF